MCSQRAVLIRCLQQIEDFGDGTVTVQMTASVLSAGISTGSAAPNSLLTALPRAFRTMTDPADCGPVTLAFCQDVQADGI